MSAPVDSSPLTHLRASLIATGLLLVGFAVAMPLLDHAARARLHDLLIEPFHGKDQGLWLQREAFAQKKMLPVYGSSELVVNVANRAEAFFRDESSGFTICPVGGPGNTSLMMAQKLASLGSSIRGSKIAIILSSSWFTRQSIPDDSYAGNFSELQTIELLLSPDLDPKLRARFIARMREFPDTLKDRPLLDMFCGTGGGVTGALLAPFMRVRQVMLACEDRAAMASRAKTLKPPEIELQGKPDELAALIAKAEKEDFPDGLPSGSKTTGGDEDRWFIEDLEKSKEWSDFALLLDVLSAQKVQTLIISVPLRGWHYDAHAVSREARDHFYHRIEAMGREHGYPVVDFSDHDLDYDFTLPNSSHFSPRGWLTVNRVIDDFYHDRLKAASH